MPRYDILDDLSSERLDGFDAIIDVRSPSEYAEDHLPGAINLPVLDDDERAAVGTEYKQVSAFNARRSGAALVSRNIAQHLESALADRPAGFRPLVYCWRGGMRSESMAVVLGSIGWRVNVLRGGYRTWRRAVVDALENDVTPLPVILVDGHTGSGKTAVLKHLMESGEQVIDLEGLAQHRGSVFGGFGHADQPSQKHFETGIWDALRRFDLNRPIFVEAESGLVGRRRVPKRLWMSMKAAPRIEIEAPAAVRAGFLVRAYPDLLEDTERLVTAIERLRPQHGRERIAEWSDMASRGAYRELAESLVVEHYDPAYQRARKRQGGTIAAQVSAPSLEPDAIAGVAAAVVARAETITRTAATMAAGA